MFWKLFLIFTLIPAAELYLLILLGHVVGPLATVLLIVTTGLLGAAMARREGLAVLRQLQTDLRSGIPPADHLLQGALVLLGGTLLITPGLLTDCTGMLLILPLSRRWITPRVGAWLLRKLKSGEFEVRIGHKRTATVHEHQEEEEEQPFRHPTA